MHRGQGHENVAICGGYVFVLRRKPIFLRYHKSCEVSKSGRRKVRFDSRRIDRHCHLLQHSPAVCAWEACLMKASDLTSLLHRSESETLDFKREQYPFAGASDDSKGELLKDVLAMANAWKDSDAHIVIGVEEDHGRAKSICGEDATLPDADLQLFVNSKTNCPVSFLVEVVTYKDVKVTVIKIDRDQKRPIFLAKHFGRLKANVVYIRRGSSTVEAAPDEIADMGREETTATRAEERRLARKERADRFERDFRIFLRKLDEKARLLESSTRTHVSDAMLQYRLPLDDAKAFLKEARELDLDEDLLGKLAKAVDQIREIDDYMQRGPAVFKEWYPNLRYTMQELRRVVAEMAEQYAKQNSSTRP